MKNTLLSLFTCATAGMIAYSGQVASHANFVPPGVDGARVYPEGTRQFLRLNLAHDCGHGAVHDPTLATVVILPNGIETHTTIDGAKEDLTDYLETSNQTAPAIFGIKPSADSDWNGIVISHNETLPYYNHGVNTQDVAYIQWIGGYVPNEAVENLEFVATFPAFTTQLQNTEPNCVTTLRVYMPAIQYCTNGAINGWLLDPPVGKLADALASNQKGLVSNSGTYAPFVDVQRDLAKKPLDGSCGAGKTLVVYPSDEALSKAQIVWNAGIARQMLRRTPKDISVR